LIFATTNVNLKKHKGRNSIWWWERLPYSMHWRRDFYKLYQFRKQEIQIGQSVPWRHFNS